MDYSKSVILSTRIGRRATTCCRKSTLMMCVIVNEDKSYDNSNIQVRDLLVDGDSTLEILVSWKTMTFLDQIYCLNRSSTTFSN